MILALSGPGLAFLLNGLSFIAVIGALWVVRPTTTDRRAPATHGVLDGFHDAISYIKRRTGILVGVLSAMLVAFFGNPGTQFTVVLAEEVYEAGPRVLGVLAAAVGVGAVLAAPVLSTWDTRVTRAATVRYALPGYALAVIAFGLAPNWPLGLAALLLVGACFLAVIATTNTAVQPIVADEMRGRVMSARVMGFTLSFPLGSLAQGALADVWGPQATVVAFGGCLLAAALYLASRPTLLAHLDAEDDRATRVV